MKILIAVGGGGHFAPAFSLINAFPKNWDVLVVGRKYAFEGDKAESLEYQTAKKNNIPFIPLTTGRLQRKFTKYTLPSLIKFPYGFLQALYILQRYKPDVVVSFGGYISLPVVFGASFLHIPIIIHEQTLEAGLANKIASRFADKICISWPSSAAFFPKNKTIVTGNPLKREKTDVSSLLTFQGKDKKLPLLFVTGGSGGSHAINILVEGCLEQLLSTFRVFHQTGDAKEFRDFERLEEKKSTLGEEMKNRYILTKFLTPGEFSGVISLADLIISRAGINTVSELMYQGKPTLFIPLPYAQKDEQMKNARYMESFGMATVHLQTSLTSEKLYEYLTSMIKKKDFYEKQKDQARAVIDINGVQKIIDIIVQLSQKPAYEKL